MNPEENTANTPVNASTWPGGFGIYKASKEAMKTNLWTYIAVILLGMAFSIVPDLFNEGSLSTFASLLLNIVTFVISMLLAVAGVVILLKNVAHEKISIDESISKSFPFVINYLILNIVTGVLIFLSILALIIPVFFVLPRLILAGYFLIDKQMGPLEAISASWNATKGHVGKVYGTIGVFILIALLCITIVGIPFAIYFFIMYSAAQTLLYRHISQQELASS